MHAPTLINLNADRTHLIEVGAGATVADVKAAIQAREGEHRCAAAAPCNWLGECIPQHAFSRCDECCASSLDDADPMHVHTFRGTISQAWTARSSACCSTASSCPTRSC